MEKISYGYIDPENCIERNEATQKSDDLYISEDEENSTCEIELYDFEKTKEENLETGVKYLLVPIRRDGFGGVENEQLLSEHSKIVLKQEELFQYNNERDLVVVDYATMFGLRLNRFKNYNSDFFLCDERVLFESLIMKYEYFGFKPFFLSFPTIFKEVGIKKDRAVYIIKKFKTLGILDSEIRKDFCNGQQRQVTYYNLYTERIIELMPEIYLDEETEWDIKHDIEKYLKSGFKNNKDSESKNHLDKFKKRNLMQ